MKKATIKELEDEAARLRARVKELEEKLDDTCGDNDCVCFIEGCRLPARYEGWHIPYGGMMRRQTVCEKHKNVLGPKKS